MGKYANGEGSIYKWMKDGKVIRDEGAVTYTATTVRLRGTPSTAAPARTSATSSVGPREQLDAGAPVRDATRTVADWLASGATTLAASDRKPATREMYAHCAASIWNPRRLGRSRWIGCGPPISKLWCSSARTAGCRFVGALGVHGVAAGIGRGGPRRAGGKNAAAVVKRLGVARTEARHAATVDVTALLNAADGLRCRDMLVLIAATEMPRGEALALRWTDIDLDAGLVDRAQHPRAHRRQARGVRTQDRRSRRSALRWWRCCGRAASSKPPNGCTRVISGPTADSCSPRSSGHRSNRATSCGPSRPPRARQAWRRSGCTSVADMLGHSSIAVTGDIYGHTSDDAARAAVDGMIGTLGLWQLVK